MNLGISTKGEYGVRIMVDLARHYSEHPRSLTDISHAESLPLPYLEQLVKMLREANPPLVISTRGAHGGYRLSRNPAAISMGEIVRVLEGPIAPMICATEGEMTQICGFLDSCKTRPLWTKLRDVVARTLDSTSLADLLEETPEPERAGVTASSANRFIALSDIQVASNLGFALPAKNSEPGKVRPLS